MKKNNVELICNIAEIAGMFEDRTNVNGFLQRVVTVISKHMNSEVCSIYLLNNETQTLILNATEGLNKEYIGKLSLGVGEGIAGLALKEQIIIRVADGRDHPSYKYFDGIAEEQYRAFLAVPIMQGLTRIGVIVLQHSKTDFFDGNDANALKAIASQLAATLENAKLLMELYNKPNKLNTQGAVNVVMIKGRPACEGIAFGAAVVMGDSNDEVFKGLNEDDFADCTLDRFQQALLKTELQLEDLQQEMEKEYSDVASLIFSSHMLILRDENFSGAMVKGINEGKSVYQAIIDVVNTYVHIFTESPNQRLREKAQDIKDLGHRILENIFPAHNDHGDYEGQVLVARELLPSEMVKFSAQRPEGILIYGGGASAHVAILAKSLKVPVIFTDDSAFFAIKDDDRLILDAYQGNIFKNPGSDIIEKYEDLKAVYKKESQDIDTSSEVYTEDGARINVLANINLLSDVHLANKFQAEGVGLYRSEFPFIIRSGFPSEEEQYLIYKRLLDNMEGKEVIFRTLDIGGDKMLSYLPEYHEANPFLGLRGIRFSLKYPNVFKDQVRALLRAGMDYELKFMFPLISSIDEFLAAKQIVFECRQELKAEKIPHNNSPLLGAMIELPSIVELIDDIAREADFMSIGSNDLVQYLLGVDRANEHVSYLYIVRHPAVFRALTRIADAAANNRCELSICGDMASDPQMLEFLIGIGIHKISVNPKQIARVRKAIHKINSEKAAQEVEKILEISVIKELE